MRSVLYWEEENTATANHEIWVLFNYANAYKNK